MNKLAPYSNEFFPFRSTKQRLPNKQTLTLIWRQDSHFCGLHRETVHELGLFGCSISSLLRLDTNSAGWGQGGRLCGLRRERD
jgi:hypothetical protein